MSELRLGNILPNSMFLGSTPIKAVYLGTEKIWPSAFSSAVITTSVSLANRFVRATVVASSSTVARPLLKAPVIASAVSEASDGVGGFSDGFSSGFEGGSNASQDKGFGAGFSSGFSSPNS